jgi:excisionase family DNA binding protein
VTKLLSIRETAERLGLKTSTLYSWHSRGSLPLPVVKLGGRLLFDERDLDKLVDALKQKPQRDPFELWK